MEEIEKISEETAQGLIDVFASFNETAKEFEKAFDGSMRAYMNECKMQAAGKFIGYMEKYADATFLTRWYWLRKARKANEALLGIIRFKEEFFKNEKHEEE